MALDLFAWCWNDVWGHTGIRHSFRLDRLRRWFGTLFRRQNVNRVIDTVSFLGKEQRGILSVGTLWSSRSSRSVGLTCSWTTYRSLHPFDYWPSVIDGGMEGPDPACYQVYSKNITMTFIPTMVFENMNVNTKYIWQNLYRSNMAVLHLYKHSTNVSILVSMQFSVMVPTSDGLWGRIHKFCNQILKPRSPSKIKSQMVPRSENMAILSYAVYWKTYAIY